MTGTRTNTATAARLPRAQNLLNQRRPHRLGVGTPFQIVLAIRVTAPIDLGFDDLGLLGEQIANGDDDIGGLTDSERSEPVGNAAEFRGRQGQGAQRRVSRQPPCHGLADPGENLRGVFESLRAECDGDARLRQTSGAYNKLPNR